MLTLELNNGGLFMNIVINAIRFDTSEGLESFIEKKISKLERYFDGIIKAEVFLKIVKPETAENKHVEVRMSVPNGELFAEKTGNSFEEAVDEAMNALKKQLNRYKEKTKS